MKRLGFILFLEIIVMLFSAQNVQCAGGFYGYIPETTFNIAKDAMSRNFHSDRTVRVGIGTNNFASYEWENASIYSSGVFEIYNNKTYIGTYTSDCVDISMVGKIFILKSQNRNDNSENPFSIFAGIHNPASNQTEISKPQDNIIAKVSGPIIFRPVNGCLGIKDLKRAGQNAQYRGSIELVSANHAGKFHIINSVETEDYLKGVVPNEMPVRFGLEALKAQAISARNYVLSPRVKSNPNYDVVDSVASQVYFGVNTEKELATRAVEETFGIVALYDWNLILAQYSSTAGGCTESYSNAFSEPNTKQFPANPKPYLTGVPDDKRFNYLNIEENAEEFYKSKPKSFDNESPYYRWEREWTIDELQTEIQNHIAAQSAAGFVHPVVNPGQIISKIKDIRVIQRGVSGKIMKLEIQTEKETYTVEKELVIRRLFTVKGKALPSANFVFEIKNDESGNITHIKIYGGGFGHGVGLSQYGAGYMGTKLKKSYDKILKHYYTGISLGTEPFILSASQSQSQKTQTFYKDNKKAYLIVDNKYKINYIDVNINGTDKKITFDTSQRINEFDLTQYLNKGMNTITFYYPKSEGNKGLRMYIELAEDDDGNN